LLDLDKKYEPLNGAARSNCDRGYLAMYAHFVRGKCVIGRY